MEPSETIDHAGTANEKHVVESKCWRKELNNTLQNMREFSRREDDKRSSRERSLAITKVEEAIMWLGMDLKALNDGVSRYRHGDDPENAKVDPVPDGVL